MNNINFQLRAKGLAEVVYNHAIAIDQLGFILWLAGMEVHLLQITILSFFARLSIFFLV
jgi:hypothetical protein